MRMMPRAVPMRMCVLRMRVGPWSMQTPEIRAQKGLQT